MREGFEETFKPSIETSEAVKTSIDTQQNKLIKQLQDNQLALTAGLEGNRLAITQGFDKMDEVKKSDLLQLPGYEAIEHPEMKETSKPAIKGREITYKISNRDLNKLADFTLYDESEDAFLNEEQLDDLKKNYADLFEEKYKIVENYLSPDLVKLELVTQEKDDPIYKISLNDHYRISAQENKLKKDGDKEILEYKESEINRLLSEKTDLRKYRVDIEKDAKIVQVTKIPKIYSYNEKDLSKYLGEDDKKRLIFYGLKTPSEYKDVSFEEFQKLLIRE